MLLWLAVSFVVGGIFGVLLTVILMARKGGDFNE